MIKSLASPLPHPAARLAEQSVKCHQGMCIILEIGYTQGWAWLGLEQRGQNRPVDGDKPIDKALSSVYTLSSYSNAGSSLLLKNAHAGVLTLVCVTSMTEQALLD